MLSIMTLEDDRDEEETGRSLEQIQFLLAHCSSQEEKDSCIAGLSVAEVAILRSYFELRSAELEEEMIKLSPIASALKAPSSSSPLALQQSPSDKNFILRVHSLSSALLRVFEPARSLHAATDLRNANTDPDSVFVAIESLLLALSQSSFEDETSSSTVSISLSPDGLSEIKQVIDLFKQARLTTQWNNWFSQTSPPEQTVWLSHIVDLEDDFVSRRRADAPFPAYIA